MTDFTRMANEHELHLEREHTPKVAINSPDDRMYFDCSCGLEIDFQISTMAIRRWKDGQK